MTDEKEKEKGTCEFECADYRGFQRGIYKCNRPLYDDEHCIFHSEDIEGKKDEFNEKFWKEVEIQKEQKDVYDFTCFVFPPDFVFNEIGFEKDVCFIGAEFSGDIGFFGVKFIGSAEFSGVKFKGDTYFGGTLFNGNVSFGNACFSGTADFRGSILKGNIFAGGAKFYGKALFRGIKFSGKAEFMSTSFFKSAIFSSTQFSGEADFREIQFSGAADFSKAKFKEDTNFEDITLEKYNSFAMLDTYFYNVSGLFEFIEANKKKFRYSNKTEFLPDNFRLILGEEATARYPIISRKIRDDMYLLKFKEKHPKLHFIWWLFADCGRSILRWALWSILFAVIFAAIFYSAYQGNVSSFRTVHVSETIPAFSFLYYSIVTFTTLGFGDIVPKTDLLQFWVMLEVILGYIMLGGLISILANKLARRS